MARKKKRGSTSYAYFKKLFQDNPALVEERSNAGIFARFREDHGMAPDAEIAKTDKNNLANLKTGARKKLYGSTDEGANASLATVTARRVGTGKLEGLEEMIDDCIIIARNLDPDGLDETIRHLRRARNLIILKGER